MIIGSLVIASIGISLRLYLVLLPALISFILGSVYCIFVLIGVSVDLINFIMKFLIKSVCKFRIK
jgi:hypothetical protein